MKKIICLLVLVCCMFSLVACGKENTLIVVTSPDYPPYEFEDTTKSGQEKYVGADVELMKYIAEKLGMELVIETKDFNSALSLLQTGAVDLGISGFTYEKERAENYEMSKPYDSEGSQGVLISKEKIEKYKDLNSLNISGIKVAAQDGSTQQKFVTNYLPNVEEKKITEISDGVLYLTLGEVEALAISERTAESIMTAQPDKFVYLNIFPVDIRETQMFVFAKKGNTELIAKVNKIIDEVVEKDLYSKWVEEAEALAEELAKKEDNK